MKPMTAMEEYLFDLHGYSIIPNALDAEHIAPIKPRRRPQG